MSEIIKCHLCGSEDLMNANCYDCLIKKKKESRNEGIEFAKRKWLNATISIIKNDFNIELEKMKKEVFDKAYEKGYQDGLKGREKRKVLCPDCGNGHIISRGSSWECRTCGRRFQKIYRQK